MVSDRAFRKKSPVNAAVQIRKLIYVVCIFGAGPGNDNCGWGVPCLIKQRILSTGCNNSWNSDINVNTQRIYVGGV